MTFRSSVRLRAAFAVGILLAVPGWSQTLINLQAQGKNVDFSGSATTRPVKTGTVLPAACQIGDLFFKTNAVGGQNFYGCAATNTWMLQSGGGTGGGAVVQAGATGGVLVTTSAGITSLDADTGFLMTNGNHNSPSGNMTPSAGVWNLTAVDGLLIRNGAADPATCAVGELFVNTGATPVLKLCTAVDTWSATGSGGSGGTTTTPSVRILTTGSSAAICPASQTALTSFTIPANTLAAGDVVDIRAVWKKTGIANIGQMKILFGAQQVGGTVTIGSGEAFAFTESSIYVTGSSAQRSFSRSLRANTSTSAVGVASPAESVAGNITVSFTGEGCSGGDTLSVDWFDIMVKKNAN